MKGKGKGNKNGEKTPRLTECSMKRTRSRSKGESSESPCERVSLVSPSNSRQRKVKKA